MKKSGKSPKEIGTLLKEKYGLDLQSSTLSTFYNKNNMKKYKKECHRYSLMASGETSINKIQRPTILLDMEFGLVSKVKESFNMGNVVRVANLAILWPNFENLAIFQTGWP